MRNFKTLVYLWLPVIFWCALIFYLSSFHKLQASEIGWQDFIVRKTAHLLEYFILYILFYRAFKNTCHYSLKKNLFVSFFFAFLYSLTDEFHQTLVSGRTGRIFDIGVDSLGGLLALFFVWLVISKYPNN